jgi:hypothetical protein
MPRPKRKQRRLPRWRRSRRATQTKIVAIVDTNVLLDLLSCHDVIAAREQPRADAWYRFDRAAYGLRLAIHFHEIRATTLSAGDEVLFVSTKLVPTEATDLMGWYRYLWLFFTKPKLLCGWRAQSGSTKGKGNAVDDALIDFAKKYSCPLISNEGINSEGLIAKNRLRSRAADGGVTVMTPEEVCRGKRLSHTALQRFLNRFIEVGPSFDRQHKWYEAGQHRLAEVHDYYGKLLVGTEPEAVADRAARVSTGVS